MSNAGKSHMQRVSDLGRERGCIVCGEPFAHVHHILEGRTPGRRSGDFCTVPLCYECHKARATINRATGLQPGRASPIGAVPAPIHSMGGR